MNAVGTCILITLFVVVFFLSKRWALLGMFAAVLYLTHAQVVVLFGFNIFALRFIEIAGFGRVLLKKELANIKIVAIDKILLALYLYTTFVFLIRSKIDHANSIGIMLDILLTYFTFRALIVNMDDIRWLLSVFVIILAPYVMLIAVEMMTHSNPFSIIGGLQFVEREGRLRCMGSFRHPSLLGTLGAALLPLYIALFFYKDTRNIGIAGIVLCLGIIFLANSGGPVSAGAIGVVGWLLWIMRDRMFIVRRTLVVVIIGLAIIMKAPIWYLPAKISAFTGGDGWHRSYLLDMAFRDIYNWWMVGMDMALTQDWFPYLIEVTAAADITNQFLSLGLQAGLLSTILFIYLLVKAFQSVSYGLDALRTQEGNSLFELLVWGLGCTIAVHIATWFGITYFDQTFVIWMMQLAAVASLAQSNIITSVTSNPEMVSKPISLKLQYHRYRKQ